MTVSGVVDLLVKLKMGRFRMEAYQREGTPEGKRAEEGGAAGWHRGDGSAWLIKLIKTIALP